MLHLYHQYQVVVTLASPETVKLVTPVTTPASTFTAPSNTIAEPSAGVRLIAPVEVLIVTAASPAVISSDLIELADTPVIPEPSPVKGSRCYSTINCHRTIR